MICDKSRWLSGKIDRRTKKSQKRDGNADESTSASKTLD
jgi:hypothetical protein